MITCITMCFLCLQDGETALHIAARNGKAGAVHLLLQTHADSSIKDNVRKDSECHQRFC